MTLTAHVAVGAAVGLATKNPILGFAAGFVSHFVLDAIAHTDLGSLGASLQGFRDVKGWKVIIFGDIVAAAIIFAILFYKTNYLPAVFWGAAGGVLPDVIDNSPFWSPALRKVFPANYFHAFHEAIHFTITNRKFLWVGAVTQLVVIVGALFYILQT